MTEEITTEPSIESIADESISGPQNTASERLEATDPTQSITGEETAATEETTESEVNPNLVKLKIDGEEVEYDLSNQEQLIKDLQLSKAANQRFQAAQEQAAQIQAFAEEFKTNPISVMEKLGLSPREIAEQYLEQQYANEDLSPEERELNDLRSEKEQWEANQTQQQEQAEAQYKENLISEQREVLTTNIVSALDSSSLPKNEHTLSLMAQAMASNNCSPQEALPMVEQHMQSLITHFVSGNIPPEKLESLLGKETLNTIRKHHISKVQANPEPTQTNNPTTTRRKETQPQDLDDFLNDL